MKRIFVFLIIILMLFIVGCKESEPEPPIIDTHETELIREESVEVTGPETEVIPEEIVITSDIKVNVLVEPSLMFDQVYDFNGGIAKVVLDDKYGFVNKFGEFVLPVEYDMFGDFHDGMAWALKGDKYGFIDTTGNLVIPLTYHYNGGGYERYDTIVDFSEGLAAVSIDGKCGFIDKTGELVIPAIYDGEFYKGEWSSYYPKFRDGFARVRILDHVNYESGYMHSYYKYGYINKSGEVTVPFEYDSLGNYFGYSINGITQAVKDGKSGLVDVAGNVVVPFVYEFILYFNGDLAYVYDHNIFPYNNGFYVNTDGVEVTAHEFSGNQWSSYIYEPAHGGLTIACRNEKFGCIDRDGNIVIPFEYDFIEYRSAGYFYCYNHWLSEVKGGCFDKNGNRVEYVDEVPYYEGVYVTIGDYDIPEFRHKYGFTDDDGNIAVPYIYDYALNFHGSLAWVQKDGLWGILEIVQ
ncbi:MAG: WG repeat-containing protein [Oscillospiraceae bacterium]|nr:WG repeat-containing protein [Oscillospiraceae bacterium]